MSIVLDGTSGVTTPGITDSGNLSVAGTAAITGVTTLSTVLGVAQGGTGATSLTANNVLLGNGTSAVATVAPGTAGNVLTSDGTTWASTAIPSQGMVLIGSITPTAVNSIGPVNVTLTNYKALLFSFASVASANEIYISSNNQQSGGGFYFGATMSGTAILELTLGAIGGSAYVNTIANTLTTATFGFIGGLTNITTASTTIYLRAKGVGTFTAGGNIAIYGVK